MNSKKVPVISVVTINWNGKDELLEFYESLFTQSMQDFEAILVDNGSDDGSQAMVRDRFPKVHIIELDKNYGFAEPNNIGLKHARGKYIVTLNNDLALAPDFLESLAKAADNSSDNTFAIGAKMIFYDNRNSINSVGIQPLLNGNGINIGKNEDPQLHNKPTKIYGPCAGAALYKKAILKEIGFFDPRYFAYLEDLDLAHRANHSGYIAQYCPDAICYHKHSVTSSRFPFFKLYLIERNRLLNLVKYKNILWLLAETPITTYYVLSHLLNKKKKAKVSKNQRDYFALKNVFKIIQIYIKARIYVIIHYAEFRERKV